MSIGYERYINKVIVIIIITYDLVFQSVTERSCYTQAVTTVPWPPTVMIVEKKVN